MTTDNLPVVSTEAGKRLHDELATSWSWSGTGPQPQRIMDRSVAITAIEAESRAAALREVAEKFKASTLYGVAPIWDAAVLAILTEATGALPDEQAGPWKCRVCGGLGTHTVEGVEGIPDHTFRPPEATGASE